MPRTKFQNLRPCLRPELRSLPDHLIERVIASHGLEANAIEDFWDDLGNVVASALPVVGGAVGSIIAPGVGTTIGAGLGSVAGSALHSAIGPGQQPATAQPAGAYQTAAPQYGSPVSSQQLAAQLMQLVTRPEFMQALTQMLLGAAGNPTVSVPAAGAKPAAPAAAASAIPNSVFTNALSTLASLLSEAYNAERGITLSSGPFHYGASPWGASVDLASPESRAGALMERLRESGDGGAGAILGRRQRKQRLKALAQALRAVDSRRGAMHQV